MAKPAAGEVVVLNFDHEFGCERFPFSGSISAPAAGAPGGAAGATGDATGPHVHFEVLKDGRQIDPMAFVGR